jgi:hypothetical protein
MTRRRGAAATADIKTPKHIFEDKQEKTPTPDISPYAPSIIHQPTFINPLSLRTLALIFPGRSPSQDLSPLFLSQHLK